MFLLLSPDPSLMVWLTLWNDESQHAPSHTHTQHTTTHIFRMRNQIHFYLPMLNTYVRP